MRIFTIDQAAEKLGVRPSTVLKYIRKGELVARRLGHRGYRISEQSLDDFLRPHEVRVRYKT